MALFKAKRRAFWGGKIREPGDVVEMDCTLEEAGSAWGEVDADLPPDLNPTKVDDVFGPAIPTPDTKKTKAPAKDPA